MQKPYQLNLKQTEQQTQDQIRYLCSLPLSELMTIYTDLFNVVEYKKATEYQQALNQVKAVLIERGVKLDNNWNNPCQ
jgi:hypothetical protein